MKKEMEAEGGIVSMFIFLLCAFHLEGSRLALVTPRAPRPLPRDKVKRRSGSET